jgi:hypothetical protein
MTFELRSEEIQSDQLIESRGETTTFYICFAGGRPEAPNCFFYGDDRYQFFFYGEMDFKPSAEYDVIISNATVKRLTGPKPKISNSDIEYIQKNIEKFFSEHSFILPHRPIDRKYPVRKIYFTWKVGI